MQECHGRSVMMHRFIGLALRQTDLVSAGENQPLLLAHLKRSSQQTWQYQQMPAQRAVAGMTGRAESCC